MFKSIKFQVIAILAVQIIALLGTIISSLYLINLRQHDYLILHLSGQLQVLTRSMVSESRHYVEQAPRNYEAYNRDLKMYYRDLRMHIDTFDNIVQSLRNRVIKAELLEDNAFTPVVIEPNDDSQSVPSLVPNLVTTDEALICTWDAPSRSQMSKTADDWQLFHDGINEALGPDLDNPRLEAAAEYILLNEQKLTLSTIDLSNTFRHMMEYKLSQIKLLNQISIAILITVSLLVLLILYRRVFRPISKTVRGFKRVANGELDYQVPVIDKSEIGTMTIAFNSLTQRLATLFRLSDRINQTDNLNETLKFIYEEFPVFFPVDWVGVLRCAASEDAFYLDRDYGQKLINITERDYFESKNSIYEDILQSNQPFCSCMQADDWQRDQFTKQLFDSNQSSIFYLPLIKNNLESAILVISTGKENAYSDDHLQLLTNIASHVGHSFEKTIGMESLVISTVKGLAKLAESRDPETGDHLFRMSHYSSFIAKALSESEKYSDLIDSSYIRDILMFAPMHDIGKVGIHDDILLKPGKLNNEEFAEMQRHPDIGADVLRRCEKQMNAAGRSVFGLGIEIAEGHHEKFNGRGYPNKLKGDDIPLSARIVAVADVFDALTSKRPYKEAWTIEKAIKVINEDSGEHFDPDVIAALHMAMPKIMEIYDKHKHV